MTKMSSRSKESTDAGVGQPSDENTDDEEEEDPFAFGSDAANDGDDDDSSDEEEEDLLAFPGRRLHCKQDALGEDVGMENNLSDDNENSFAGQHTNHSSEECDKLMKSKIVMAAYGFADSNEESFIELSGDSEAEDLFEFNDHGSASDYDLEDDEVKQRLSQPHMDSPVAALIHKSRNQNCTRPTRGKR